MTDKNHLAWFVVLKSSLIVGAHLLLKNPPYLKFRINYEYFLMDYGLEIYVPWQTRCNSMGFAEGPH